MKDQCRQRIQQKGWQVDPTALRILKETRRRKWFRKKVKEAVINYGVFSVCKNFFLEIYFVVQPKELYYLYLGLSLQHDVRGMFEEKMTPLLRLAHGFAQICPGIPQTGHHF